MSHKIFVLDSVTKKKRTIPYLHERVDFSRSWNQIQDLIRNHGCEQIATAQKQVTDTTHGTYIKYSLAFIIRGEKFMIEFPVIFEKTVKRGIILRMDISGRIIFYKIKVLLTDVEIGYLSFSEAMMPFRIVTLPGGMQVPLADYVEDHGKELSTGTADLLQLPGGR